MFNWGDCSFFRVAGVGFDLPLECFFTEEVTLAQCTNVFLFRCVRLFYRYADLTPADYKERIASSTLAYYVITVVVESLSIENKSLNRWFRVFYILSNKAFFFFFNIHNARLVRDKEFKFDT